MIDDLAKESLDQVRVQPFFLRPTPTRCQHQPLALAGVDFIRTALEATGGVDILATLADGSDDGPVQPVDFRSNLGQRLALLRRFHPEFSLVAVMVSGSMSEHFTPEKFVAKS